MICITKTGSPAYKRREKKVKANNKKKFSDNNKLHYWKRTLKTFRLTYNLLVYNFPVG